MRFLAFVFAFVCPVGLLGQTATPPPPPPAAPPSFAADPTVNPDRTVTFHYLAPKAATVGLALEGVKDPIPMTKAADGTWTYTTAAMPPEVYGYHFEVDGSYTIDPHNVWVKTSALNVGNYFLVPGATPQPWELTEVPHGTLREQRFTTSVVKGLEQNQSSFYVYTPPGYDPRGSVKYPVLYLLHGWSDLADGWARGGQAGLIMDNLIATHKAKPMIVVMPLGYGDMSFVKNGWGVWQDPAQINHNLDLFTQTLLNEIIPQVEKSYSVSTKREDRAIAGLSMGGLEALSVGLNHTKMFDYVGGFSSAVHQLKQDGLTGLDAKTANLKLLWIACGTEDGLITANRSLISLLKQDGLAVTPVETPGMHVWMVWRDNLVHFAPLLF